MHMWFYSRPWSGADLLWLQPGPLLCYTVSQRCFMTGGGLAAAPTGHAGHRLETRFHITLLLKMYQDSTSTSPPNPVKATNSVGVQCSGIVLPWRCPFGKPLFTAVVHVDPVLKFRHIPFPRAPLGLSGVSPAWDQSESSWKYNGRSVHWVKEACSGLVYDKQSLQVQSLMKYSSRDEAVTSIPSSHLYRSPRLLSFAFFSSISNGTHWDSSITHSTPLWRKKKHHAHKCYHYPQYIAGDGAIYHRYLCAATSVCALRAPGPEDERGTVGVGERVNEAGPKLFSCIFYSKRLRSQG